MTLIIYIASQRPIHVSPGLLHGTDVVLVTSDCVISCLWWNVDAVGCFCDLRMFL